MAQPIITNPNAPGQTMEDLYNNFIQNTPPSPLAAPPAMQPANLEQSIDPNFAMQQNAQTQALQQGTNTFPIDPAAYQQQVERSNYSGTQMPHANLEQALQPKNLAVSTPNPASTPQFPSQVAQQTQVPQNSLPQNDAFNKALAQQNAYMGEFNKQAASMQKAGEYAQAIETVKGDMAGQVADETQKIQSLLDDSNRIAKEKVDEKLKTYAEASDQFAKLVSDPEKLDEAFRPRGIFEGKSTGQTILGMIAIGLGGIGAAMQGHGAQNQALNMIMKQLDKENEGRKEAFKAKVAGQRQIADQALQGAQVIRQSAADEQADLMQKKNLQIEAIIAKTEQLAAPYKGRIAGENAKMLISGLRQEQAKNAMAFQQLQMEQEKMRALNGLDYQTFKKMSPAQRSLVPKNMLESFDNDAKRDVAGYGLATNQDAAQKFQEKRRDLEPAINQTREILNSLDNFNKLDLKDRAEMQSRIIALTGNMRLAYLGPGAMTEKEYDRLLQAVGNPAGLATLPAVEKARLKTVLGNLESTLGTQAKIAGLPPKDPNSIASQFGATKANFK